MYRTAGFKLVINEDDQELMLGKKVIVKGCDNIIQLMLDLAIADSDNPPRALAYLDLTDDELSGLELMLSKAILQDNKCVPDVNEED